MLRFYSPAFTEDGWVVLIETYGADGTRLDAEWVADCGDFAAADDLALVLNGATAAA